MSHHESTFFSWSSLRARVNHIKLSCKKQKHPVFQLCDF